MPTFEKDYSGFYPYLIHAELGLKLLRDPYEHSQYGRPEIKAIFLLTIKYADETQALLSFKDPHTKKPVPVAASSPILEAIKLKHL